MTVPHKGGEFQGPCKKLFKERKIIYKQKIGLNKCNFAESAIYILKKKLYLMLRSGLSKDWIKYLPNVVNSYNSTPLKKLGFLKPNDINTEFDSVLVDAKKQQQNISSFQEPTITDQIKNQKTYEKNPNKLQVEDYVYLNFNEKLFDKSFDVQVRAESKFRSFFNA